MEMAYRERWRAEIAELRRILSGFERSPKLLAQGDLKGVRPCSMPRCRERRSNVASSQSAAIDYLLGRPLRGWTWRHRHVQNACSPCQSWVASPSVRSGLNIRQGQSAIQQT